MNEYFAGTVSVYNETFFIDANTGIGFDRLIAKIDPLLFKMSKAFYINGYSQEDLKQELAILAIEGVRTFDTSKNVKLSTFLHIHLHNKLISKIKSKNKLSNNAFSTSENGSLPKVCECGSDIFSIIEKSGEEVARECASCDRVYRKEIRIAKREIGFSDVTTKRDKDGSINKETLFIDSVASSEGMYFHYETPEQFVELEASINSICNSPGMDEITAKILRMVALEDFTIKEAAEELGITSWAASLKLKSLARNGKIKTMLERR